MTKHVEARGQPWLSSFKPNHCVIWRSSSQWPQDFLSRLDWLASKAPQHWNYNNVPRAPFYLFVCIDMSPGTEPQVFMFGKCLSNWVTSIVPALKLFGTKPFIEEACWPTSRELFNEGCGNKNIRKRNLSPGQASQRACFLKCMSGIGWDHCLRAFPVSHTQACDTKRWDLGAIQRPQGWKRTWRAGDRTVCFSASSWELHQTKAMAWIACHRMGLASASSRVHRALCGDKRQCAILESLHLFRDVILVMIIRVWSVKEATRSGQWEYGWTCGKVGKGQPQKVAGKNHSSNFHKKEWGMWPRKIHTISATYSILHWP